MKLLITIVATATLSGCAGTYEYTQPSSYTEASKSKIIKKPKAEVWKAAIPKLGEQFFVINNVDKDSGLINLSYSGSPVSYVDCGWLKSVVKNARGERTYNFPAAEADTNFEIMDIAGGNGLLFVKRSMSLDGRINLIFEDISSSETKVTANIKYLLTKKSTITNTSNQSASFNDVISFNSGGNSSYPPSGQIVVSCHAKGTLEAEILSTIAGE